MSETKLKTACCKREPEVTARISIRMPWTFAHNLNKRALRDKAVQIEAADWLNMTWSCPGCNRFWLPGELPELADA